MATIVATIVDSLKGIKELLGAFGVIGNLLVFYFKFPSKYAIPLGLFGSLFIAIWGLFERNNASSILRTLAWIGIIVGVSGIIFFASVGSVVLLRDPSSPGKVKNQEASGFDLISR